MKELGGTVSLCVSNDLGEMTRASQKSSPAATWRSSRGSCVSAVERNQGIGEDARSQKIGAAACVLLACVRGWVEKVERVANNTHAERSPYLIARHLHENFHASSCQFSGGRFCCHRERPPQTPQVNIACRHVDQAHCHDEDEAERSHVGTGNAEEIKGTRVTKVRGKEVVRGDHLELQDGVD